MRELLLPGLAIVLLTASVLLAEEKPVTRPASVLDFTVDDTNGKPVPLANYRGKVLLIVNTASKCGHTPQYEGLQKLYDTYKDRGFEVLAFPANDFGQQEPGTNQEIQQFCSLRYAVKFPLFSKIVVKGEGQAPLYQFLTDPATNGQFAGPIGWNFTKFLVSRDGKVLARFEPGVEPQDQQVVSAIEAALGK